MSVSKNVECIKSSILSAVKSIKSEAATKELRTAYKNVLALEAYIACLPTQDVRGHAPVLHSARVRCPSGAYITVQVRSA